MIDDFDDFERTITKIANRLEELGLPRRESTFAPVITVSAGIRSGRDLAPFIEHTNLRPEATGADIARLCEEAKEFGFAGVCVNPVFVAQAKRALRGTNVLVVTVVGFPLGAVTTDEKTYAVKRAIEDGADEIDAVIPIGALKESDYRVVYDDIHHIVETSGRPVKAILETGVLGKEEKIAACLIAVRAGAAFVKTSTGFLYTKTQKGYELKGATVEDVALMRRVVGDKIGIKAAGGIKDFATARAMLGAGAGRIGSSASVAIVSEK